MTTDHNYWSVLNVMTSFQFKSPYTAWGIYSRARKGKLVVPKYIVK